MLVITLVVLFFLPLFLNMAVTCYNNAYPKETVNLYVTIAENYNASFDDVKRAAFRKAASGDTAAMNWVLRYNQEQHKQRANKTAGNKPILTDQAIINDAIQGLVALGMKKSEAVVKINNLAHAKKYTNVNNLLVASMRK